MNKKFIILAVCLLGFSGLSLSGCGNKEAEEREATLRADCATLTAEDTEGRVYEAIVGNYVKDRSHGLVEYGVGHGTQVSFKTTLKNKTKEVSVHNKNIKDEKKYKSYKDTLDKVIYSNKNNPHSKDYVYGMCGYKNQDGEYTGAIETLTLIKGR